MKNKLLNVVVILALLLIVSVGLNIVQHRNAKEEQNNAYAQNRRNQETIQRAGDSIKTAVARINELEAKGIRTRDSAKVAQNAAKREIQAYRQTIAKLRPLVQAKIDSFPDLRDFVAAQDSTISRQDSLIYRAELFCTLQIRDLQEIVQLTEQKYAAQEQITAAVTEQLAKETRDHRKTKRRSALKSVGLGILTGGIIYISIRE